MQRLILSLLICLGFVLPATAQAWWQDDWHYRKQIAVDTTPQGAAINQVLGRTALLVRLHTGNFTFDGVKEDGSDLRFVAADDKTVLNHQIESFDALMGMALIWVDVPNVEGGQRQDIWMYYGNQKAPATGNGQLTFDPNYTALYHFDGATGTPAKDTTAYGNTAQSATGTAIDGVVGRALQFSGQPLLLPASPSLQHNAGSAFTFSAWLRLDQASGEQVILARREGTQSLLIGVSQGLPFVEIDGQRAAATQALTPAQWQHLALTAEGSKVTLYINGRESAALAQAMPAFNSVMAIGADLHEGAFQPFAGAIDELRLS
jgi:biopolymer transport protein ExbB